MNTINRLLEFKKRKKRFLRQDAHKLHLPKNWRKPRGMHNKMRLGKKGHRVKPDSGYRSPRILRHIHQSNLIPVKITSLKELEQIDNKKHIVIISKRIGAKKRLTFIKKCIESNVLIFNYKNPSLYLEQKTKEKEKSKKLSKQKSEIRTKTREELSKKAEEQKDQPEKDKEVGDEGKVEERKILQIEPSSKHRPESKAEKRPDKFPKTNVVRTKIPTGGDRGT